MRKAITNLSGFNPARGICAMLAVGLVAFGASTPSALAASVPVGNPSFETEGTFTPNYWYALPDVGSWVKGQANIYQILDTSIITNPHFPAGNAPEGNNVLNLSTASPLTQDLSTAISNGYLITMSFYLGNSTAQDDPPASPTATFTLDGSDVYSEIVTNNAANGAFVLKTVQWTATSAGNLGIKFTSAAGCWLDTVSVTVIDPNSPTTTATYDGATGNWNLDTWNTASNWEPQQVPDDGVATPWEVIIAAGKFVSVSEFYSGVGVVTPVYTGDLTLQANATLLIAASSTDADLRALGTGTITMNAGATIAFRLKADTVHDQDISLLGDATIDLGQSNSAEHNSRTFNGTISGAGRLTVRGTKNNKGIFAASNPSWSGGLLATRFATGDPSRIEGAAVGCFGTGNVTIDVDTSLQINAAGAIDDGATLSLNGAASTYDASKLVMNANDQVFELWIDGVQQPDGEYTSSESWLSGTGTLTVKGPPAGTVLIVR